MRRKQLRGVAGSQRRGREKVHTSLLIPASLSSRVSSQSHHPGTFFLGAVDYHLGLAETSEEGRSRIVQYGAGIRESRENSAWAAQPTQWFSGW